jgi:3-oxoadipate enol-lactonase
LPRFGKLLLSAAHVTEEKAVRASAQWCRRLSERFATRHGRRGIAHLRNYRTEYLVAGDGEPVVLVPGLAGGYELLGRLARILARDFQVICFQLRGDEDPHVARRPHNLCDLADDLADLVDTLLLERPTVVGVSFGSAVTLECALRHPQKFGRLALHGVEARFRNRLGGHIARLALEEFPLPHDNPFFNQFFRMLFARREAIGPLFDYVTARCWSTDQHVIAQRLGMLADFDVRDRIRQLTVPTLIVAGQEDSIISAAAQEELAQSIPGGQFKPLAGAGHLCFLTRPNAFARAVSEFVAPVPVLAAA